MERGVTLFRKDRKQDFCMTDKSNPLVRVNSTLKMMRNWSLKINLCFCTATEAINKMKRQTTERENIFANHIFDKGLVPKIYEKLI